MLGYFPTPYDNELLYSLIARYSIHVGLENNRKAVLREVFSSPTAVAVPDLPSHLEALVENLQLVWPTNSEDLISQFTLAPHPLRYLLVLTALMPGQSVTRIFDIVGQLPDKIQEKAVVKAPANSVLHADVVEHRNAWIELMHEFPDAGVKVLRTIGKGNCTYAWLYRRDKKWLEANKPENKIHKPRRHLAYYQIWDVSNVMLLEAVYSSLRDKPNRRRLTRTKFIQVLPRHSSVEKHLKDLPLTKKWLTEHEESVENYQIYRLNNAYKTIIHSNKSVKRWRLLRISNVRYELLTPKIETVIMEMEARIG